MQAMYLLSNSTRYIPSLIFRIFIGDRLGQCGYSFWKGQDSFVGTLPWRGQFVKLCVGFQVLCGGSGTELLLDGYENAAVLLVVQFDNGEVLGVAQCLRKTVRKKTGCPVGYYEVEVETAVGVRPGVREADVRQNP